MYRCCILLLILLLILSIGVRYCVEKYNCVCFGLVDTDTVFEINERDKRIEDIDVSDIETFKLIIDSCEHHKYMIQLFPNERRYKARIIE